MRDLVAFAICPQLREEAISAFSPTPGDLS